MDNVAIFWDYENCPVPSNVSGFAVVNNLRTLAHPYGSVRSLKAYIGLTEQSPMPKALAVRSELQSSGVSLVDCPHNGRKDVADKMIIVDMLAHAIDNPAPSTIILITGDRDFAYAISILRLRQYRIILVTLPNAHPSLTAQASVCISWNETILPPSVAIDSPNIYEKLLPREQQEFTDNDVSTSPCNSTSLKSPRVYYMQARQESVTNIPPTPKRFFHGKSASVEFVQSLATNLPHQPSTSGHSKALPAFTHPQPPSWTIDLLPPFTFKPKGFPMQNLGPQPRDEIKVDLVQPTHGNEDFMPQPPSNRTTPIQNEFEQSCTPSPDREPEITETTLLEMATASLTPQQNAVQQNPTDVVEKESGSLVVPLHFEVLVQCLQRYQAKGILRPLRSAVAYEVGKFGVFRKVGVTKFKQYGEMAQSLGIIDLGGTDGKAWICILGAARIKTKFKLQSG